MTTSRCGIAFLVLACLGLAGCGSSQPLDQAIQCNQFTRQADGGWTTTTEVSLDYEQNGTRYQDNYGKGATISTQKGGQEAVIVAALEKKCAPSH
jgi:ABC-type glycerol-3-phosphate transport system substrate-binding protein